MIDIHCHLLPVDDGVKDFNEAVNQIQEGIKHGVTDFVITPHYRPTKNYVCDNLEIQEKFDELHSILGSKNIAVNLYLGREIDEVKDIEKLIDTSVVSTMNNTDYLLLDFGVNKADIKEYIYELKLKGYKVIIAHIERYKYLEELNEFDEIKKEGALIQVNASSILHPRNRLMKRKMKYLLKNKLVDFVASDAHRNPDSYQMLEKAYKYVSKKYGTEYADDIFENNAKILFEL